MKKTFLIILSILFFNIVCFAQIKTFKKQGESVVQKDQSVNQVIAYLKQKLTREAQEQAGTFITTNLKIENYQITKDEFKSFAGSISKIKVLEENSFMKKQEQYVRVKIQVDVDTDNVKAYLEKIMQDNEYKEQAQKAIKEAEQLKKENLELEKKLKTATKQEYERNLSLQAEQLIETQKQREIELNKMAIEAKEEFTRATQIQKQKEIKRQEELNALKKQIEQENLKTQKKIVQEKDNIKKAELENQAKIKDLENKAKENMINWQQITTGTTIEQVIEEATKIKKEVNELFNKFEKLSKTNKQDLIKSYDMQINILKATKFQEKKPIKDSWETQSEYNAKLQEYENNKYLFEKNINNKIEELKQTKDDNLLKDEIETLKITVNTTRPFIEKLQYFQTERFYSKDGIKAKSISVGEINAEEKYFILNVNYKNKNYSLNYKFSDIGKEKAKLIYQTANQFVIEPLFSVNDNLKKELVAFNVKHLGTKTEKYFSISTTIKKFNETNIFNIYLNKLDKLIVAVSAGDNHTVLIVAVSAGGVHTVGLKKDGTVVAVGDNGYGQCNVKNWKDIVAVSAGMNHTVGLKKDGTVVAVGYNKDGQCDVKNWKNIVAVSAGGGHTVGLRKDGTIVAVGYNKDGQCDVKNWKNIVAVSAGMYHTVGLKKDGTVVAVGDNEDGRCNVENWKDIVAVLAGYEHTVGLKKDGTVVAVGSNYSGQCGVEKWKDMVAVSAGGNHTVGPKKDGTVVAVGSNEYGQCNVGNWSINLKKIKKPKIKNRK